MKVAIVSTTKEITKDHIKFIEHHKSIGIDQFYIFIDDPNKFNTATFINNIKGVKVILKDKKLIKLWESFNEYPVLRETLDHFVVQRQALNVRVAQEMCFNDKIDWLFHIDDDELINISNWKSVGDYLYFLPDNIPQINLINYEALYEEESYEEVFSSRIKSFKKNPFYLSASQRLKAQQLKSKRYYYCSYAHGKSALNINLIKKTSIFPAGVHLFYERTASNFYQASPCDLWIQHYPFTGAQKLFDKFNGVNKKRIYQYEALAKKDEKNLYSEARTLKTIEEFQAFFNLHIRYNQDEINYLKKYKLIIKL